MGLEYGAVTMLNSNIENEIGETQKPRNFTDCSESSMEIKNGNTEPRFWGLSQIFCRLLEEALNLEPSTVGINDGFFELGGDSLLAVKLINKINKHFKVSMSIRSVFECDSMGELAAHFEQEQTNAYIIPKCIVGDNEGIRLSFRMELLWKDHVRYPNMTTFNMTSIFRIQKGFEEEKLQKALDRIVQRHEILRTVIRVSTNGKPYMLITEKTPQIATVAIKSSENLKHALLNFNNEQFQLTEDIPLRVNIFNVENSDSYLALCFHHIAADLWSYGIFLKELSEFYKNDLLERPALEIQYKDYAAFQRTLFTGQLLEEHLSFWNSYLNGLKRLDLQPDFPPTSHSNMDLGISTHFSLDFEKSAALRELAKRHDKSLFSLLLSAFYLTLAAETGQMDITICTPVACRDMFQLSGLIGLVANDAPVRQVLSSENTLESLMESVWDNVMKVQKYSGLPQSRILTESGFPTESIAGDTAWIPVSFQVDELDTEDGQVQIPLQSCDEEYPMLLDKTYNCELVVVIKVKEAFEGSFVFAADLYRQETVERFKDTFVAILQKMAAVEDYEPRLDEFLNIRKA